MPARKHHYIPKCYLKGWTGADGMLCDYRRPADDVVVKRRHPSETGWVDRLYSVSALPEQAQDIVEREFLQRVDQEASDALEVFRRGSGDLSERLQVGWARFLMSLIHRHPSQIENLRIMAAEHYLNGIDEWEPQYAELKGPDDPATFAEYRASTDDRAIEVLFARVVQQACDSENIGRHLLGMNQQIVSYQGSGRLITSDRPLLRGHALDHPEAVLVLPISPHKLFVATNGVRADDALREITRGRDVVPTVNMLIARQAFRHVYGVCENHLPLVEQHMARGLGEPWRVHVGKPG